MESTAAASWLKLVFASNKMPIRRGIFFIIRIEVGCTGKLRKILPAIKIPLTEF